MSRAPHLHPQPGPQSTRISSTLTGHPVLRERSGLDVGHALGLGEDHALGRGDVLSVRALGVSAIVLWGRGGAENIGLGALGPSRRVRAIFTSPDLRKPCHLPNT